MSKIKDTHTFIQKAKLIHGDLYVYDNVHYNGCRSKIEIICRVHGSFMQTPDAHLYNKQGCPNCGVIKTHLQQRKSIDTFTARANIIHNYFFDYSKSDYITNITKMIIMCPIHGDFWQTPSDHLSGYGCKKCGYSKLHDNFIKTIEQFIIDANKIHNNKYHYTLVKYDGAFKHVDITCLVHGIFNQTPHCHLNGNGCPKCVHQISKPETMWLDYLHIPIEYRQAKLKINNCLIKADAYDPINNTIYEFYGDYWHGNINVFDKNRLHPSIKITYGVLYNRTLKREKLIKDNGYNLITIWENDFNKMYEENNV